MSELKTKFPVVALKHVNEKYYPGIYGDFRGNLERHISSLRGSADWKSKEKIRFFEYLFDRVDAQRYEALQEAYLNPPTAETTALKYLDPVSWFEQKFDFAFKVRLHERKPIRILDLGTGPGHFLVIAQFYGHHAIGTDLPDHVDKSRPTHLYNALADIYGTMRIKHRIEPMTELAGLPSRIDLVTSFSVAFNLGRGKILWDRGAWEFFLHSLREQILAADGALFMMMVRNKVRDEVWDYLASLADWSDPAQLLLLISNRGGSASSVSSGASDHSIPQGRQ